jgi:rsbT antagonist protein RsbS
MAVPIIKLGKVLVVTVQQALHDRAALDLHDNITGAIERTGAKGLLIDVSVLDVVDSFMARMLGTIGTMALLMGTTTVIAGIQPAVAVTLTELGLDMKGMHTVLTVEKGLELLNNLSSTGVSNRKTSGGTNGCG